MTDQERTIVLLMSKVVDAATAFHNSVTHSQDKVYLHAYRELGVALDNYEQEKQRVHFKLN